MFNLLLLLQAVIFVITKGFSMENVHKVKLRLHQDNETGEYGLAHDNMIDIDESFNAFWSGVGVFHDVFEHWFEGNHEYFMGCYSANRCGELAAMGSALYFYNTLGVHNRPLSLNSITSFEESVRMENESPIIEALEYDSYNYGGTLECNVPEQEENWIVDGCIVNPMWQSIEDCVEGLDQEDMTEDQVALLSSLEESKIANASRWGYSVAEELVPDKVSNMETCVLFIDFWNSFCEEIIAEDLMGLVTHVEFEVNKDTHGDISWSAIFMNYSEDILKVDQDSAIGIYSIDDFYQFDEEENDDYAA